MHDEGKLPPQDIELEEAVLGALLIEKDAMIQSGDYVHPDTFYKNSHRQIFERGIAPLFARNENIDIRTVSNELKKAGLLEKVGGSYGIVQITNRVASADHIRSHIEILNNLSIKRNIITLASKMMKDGYDDTIEAKELLDSSAKEFDQIGSKVGANAFKNMQEVVGDGLKEIEEAGNSKGNLTGVPTGYDHLDRVTGGWQKSDFIVVAARPGMGKTAYILNIAKNAAIEFDTEIAIFSLEMASVQLGKRLISNISGIKHDKIKRGKLTPEEWDTINTKVTPLINSHIYIDDQSNISVYELTAKSRRLKHERPKLAMIIIDYLQLMTAGTGFKGNRDQEIGFITRSLKGLAKDLNIPVMALSQLSRAVEARGGDKKPMLSDLRESGSIEQDADMVQFIYRPEYYGFTEDDKGRSLINKAEIIIAKHRNGSLENVLLGVDFTRSRFLNLDDLDKIPDNNIDMFPDEPDEPDDQF